MKRPLTSLIGQCPSLFSALFKVSIGLPVIFLTGCGPKETVPGGGPSAGGASKTEPGSPAQTKSSSPTKAEAQEVPEVPPKGPASVAEAEKILDLKTFALMDGAVIEEGSERTLANLIYKVRSDVKTAYEFHRKKLTADRWKEQPNSYITDQSASGTFGRNTYNVSVTVYPDSQPGLVSVMIHHHGNVNLSKLPRPSDTKAVYEGPITAMYVTDAPVAATAENCKKLLMATGWEPHGTAGDLSYFKQNAVRISVSVASAPAQEGKTSISFQSEIMSVDLPAPPDALDLRYVDSQRKLTFDTTAEKEAVAEYYKGALAKTGFKPNKDELFSIDDRFLMVFRDAPGGVISLNINKEREGKRGVALDFTTITEIDAAGKRIKEKIARDKEKLKADEEKAKADRPKVTVELPDDATAVDLNKGSIKFTIGNGKAKSWAESWKKTLLADGWKQEAASLEGMAGMISITKGSQHLNLNYTDTGLLPAEVNITAIGVDLERPASGKK